MPSPYPRELTAEQALDKLYMVCDDNYLPWLDAVMQDAGFRTADGEMRAIPQPPSGLVQTIAVALYNRSDRWHSVDEAVAVIEENDTILTDLLDEAEDDFTAHLNDYRRNNR